MFEPLVPGAHKVPNTNLYRAPEHLRDDEKAFGRWAADRIAEAIEFEGPDTVAAVFLEPVQNSGGCFPPPAGYFERVREICDEYDVLLVSDEVICAFGRIGSMFACDDFGYVPDIITCAKGMTSGYSPIGAMIASDRLFEPFKHGHDVLPARLHLRWPPGLGRGRDGQPRHLRARGPQRPGQDERPDLQGDARQAARPAARRRRPRRRLLLRHRARQGQGDPRDVQRRRVRAAAARLPLQGALRRRPLLPRRRPRRPRHPARAAAHHGPGRSSTTSSRACVRCSPRPRTTSEPAVTTPRDATADAAGHEATAGAGGRPRVVGGDWAGTLAAYRSLG